MILRAVGLIIGLVALRVLMNDAFQSLEHSLVQIFQGLGDMASYASPESLQNWNTAGYFPPMPSY